MRRGDAAVVLRRRVKIERVAQLDQRLIGAPAFQQSTPFTQSGARLIGLLDNGVLACAGSVSGALNMPAHKMKAINFVKLIIPSTYYL